MNRPDDEIKAAVAELVADRSLDDGAHPSADELVAYHRGRMSADEEQRIRDHLLTCAEDTSLLLDLERLESGELGSEHPASEIEIAAAWRATRSALPQATAPPPRRATWLYAAAAMLSFAVLGQSLWVHSLRQTVAELSGPQLNAQIIHLLPGALRGQEQAKEVVTLAAGDRLLTLVLNPAASFDDEYDLIITGADGERVWRGKGLRPNELASLTVTLPRRLLAPGDYRLVLYGSGRTGDEPAAEFAVRIEESAEGG